MLEKQVEVFKEYITSKYDVSIFNIERKLDHSLRVMELCGKIAMALELDEEEIKVASLVGLLHDFGRFQQWDTYHTYKDQLSIDHGDLSVKLLFEKKEIEKFDINLKYYDDIYLAIKYHNKPYIPKQHETNKFVNIIRDADKIDAYYLWAIGKPPHFFSEDNSEIRERVKRIFDKQEQIIHAKDETNSEYLVLLLAYVYQLHYDLSREILKDYNVIEKMYNRLENKEHFQYYFDKINEHLGGIKC